MPAPVWPAGLSLQAFTQHQAAEAHALLELAYADGGGVVKPFAVWWPALSQDGEYDPDLCFLLCDRQHDPVAFAQCWTSAFVKDFVVHPRYRRRGIGQAMLLHVFRVFKERDAETVDLKVQTDNPSGAMAFYESLGMQQISN